MQLGVGDTEVSHGVILPAVFDELPDAYALSDSCLQVDGAMFAEVCCGEAIFTLGIMIHKVPCIKPWDSQYGERFDVIRHGEVLLALVRCKRIVFGHSAPPCQSATWGRSPAVRSWDFPEGLPNLSPKAARLVSLGNEVADFCARFCFELYAAGGYFSVENPRLSWLWALRLFLALYSLDGVIFTLVLYSDFGAAYSKPTILLHNSPTLHSLRVGVPGPTTVRLRGLVRWHGEWVARTHLASMYPPKLGIEYGACAAEAIELREDAVCKGVSVPMALQSEDFGFPLPMVGDSWLNYVVGDLALHAPDMVDPLVFRGEGAPKGLSHREHVMWALQQPHPWQGSLSVDCLDLDLALEFEIKTLPGEIDAFRFGLLEHWTSVANSLAEEQLSWSTKAGGAIRKLVQRINGPLIALLVEAIGYDDPWLVDHCQKGFPFVDHLPPCAEASAGGLKLEYKVDSSFLRANRSLLNDAVLSKLRESEFSGDVMEETLKDVTWSLAAWLG